MFLASTLSASPASCYRSPFSAIPCNRPQSCTLSGLTMLVVHGVIHFANDRRYGLLSMEHSEMEGSKAVGRKGKPRFSLSTPSLEPLYVALV
jgi:hypothetical protein